MYDILVIMILKPGSRIIFSQWFTGFSGKSTQSSCKRPIRLIIKKKFFYQVLVLVVEFGFMSGWTSPAIARLTAPDSPIHINAQQASWVASLMNLGRISGAVAGPITANFSGSKRCILVTLIPIASGWLLIFLAKSVVWLYAARILMGFGLGMGFSTFPLFIGEVSMPEIRGALISLALLGGPCGSVIASICGSYLSLKLAASFYLIICLLLMTVFFFVLPESPHHLVKIGKLAEARTSIDWYRCGLMVDEELAAVEKFVATNNGKSFSDKLGEFKRYPVRRATLHIIALFIFMQICGLNSLLFYMETILIKARFQLIEPSTIVIWVNVSSIFASTISIFLIDKCGRRFLLLFSSTGVTISMLSLMTYFLLLNSNYEMNQVLLWLPAFSMFLFLNSFNVGLLTVPSTFLSEIFPSDIKCIAAVISGVTGATTAFLSSKTYQSMADYFGETYIFMCYAIFSMLVIPYALFLMPETKGKSLQQIQDKFLKK